MYKRQVCFSADDLQLAAASEDGRIFVLNAIDGSVQHNLAVHPGMPTAVAFSHDGRNLATAGQDRIVRIWDLRTGQNLVTLDNLRGAALSLVFGPHDDELLANLEEGEVVRWTAPRDPGGQRRFAATDVALHQAMPNAAPVRALPWGDVRRNESLPEVFQQFAWLSGVGFKVLRPTFDDREEDQGLLLGALMLTHARNETLQAATTITDNDFVWLSRNADREARQLGKAGYADLFTGRLPSVVLLESGSFERRDVSVKELGEIDSDRDRIREIHRWAKAHGYVGGFPNFDDGEREGEAVYGAVLIKTGHGEEVFLPASTVWPTADSSPR